jgi:hypothetical protein
MVVRLTLEWIASEEIKTIKQMAILVNSCL